MLRSGVMGKRGAAESLANVRVLVYEVAMNAPPSLPNHTRSDAFTGSCYVTPLRSPERSRMEGVWTGIMALKLLRRLPVLGIQRCPPVGPTRLPGLSSGRQQVCATCLCTSAGRCIREHGCRRLSSGVRSLTTTAKEPSFVASSSMQLHKDSFLRFYLTQLHRPTDVEEHAFLQHLGGCSSSRQVFKLLRTVTIMSDTMAAASLHRVADLERDGGALKDPSLLESTIIRALFSQLEQDCGRLTDAGLVSALLACTRLFLDPSSTLMVQLTSESQERLGRKRMSVGQLCHLGQAMLAVEGPGSVTLKQVMSQIQKQKPCQWSLEELTAVYALLQGGAEEGEKLCKLLTAMHRRAERFAASMDPSAVSGVLSALVALKQTHVTPLVIKLCKQAVQHVPHFTDKELTHVLDALMHYGQSNPDFVEALERHVPSVAFTSHPETVSKVLQFFGKGNILSPKVFDSIAESFVYRADDYTTSQVAQQIVPFGKLGYLPPNASDVFRKVEMILRTRFSQFQPQTLLELLHSCILVERFPVNYFSKIFSNVFLQQLQKEDSGMEWLVLAQLTQLYLTMKLECPSSEGVRLLPKYRVKRFNYGGSVETPVNPHLCSLVKKGLVRLLGTDSHFGSNIVTPYCYTLDIQINLDEEGYVLPAKHEYNVYKRIALCIDGQNRFTSNQRQLLGIEAIKQRHLRLLGYDVVQIPFYEVEELKNFTSLIDYLHVKIFPHSYRQSW